MKHPKFAWYAVMVMLGSRALAAPAAPADDAALRSAVTEYEQAIRSGDVSKKEDGTWRLLRHQAVMDPSTNSWNQSSDPAVKAPEPAAPEDETAAPEIPPPASRSGKKRAWEN